MQRLFPDESFRNSVIVLRLSAFLLMKAFRVRSHETEDRLTPIVYSGNFPADFSCAAAVVDDAVASGQHRAGEEPAAQGGVSRTPCSVGGSERSALRVLSADLFHRVRDARQ